MGTINLAQLKALVFFRLVQVCTRLTALTSTSIFASLTIFALGWLGCYELLVDTTLVDLLINQVECYFYTLNVYVGAYSVQISHLAFFYLAVWVIFALMAR